MISVPSDIAGQSKHAADWLDGRKEQGPSPVLARAKRQMEELEVDWADAFAVPETESVTVPRQKKKRTEEPAATSHLPPAISASHTAKPPHPPGKVLAQKTADQQLMACTGGTESPTSSGTGQEERGRSKEEEEGRGGKEEEEGEGRGGKEEEEGEGRGREEEEEGEGRGGEETEESRGGESRKGNATRAIGVIARAMLFVARAMPCIARAMPLRYSFQASKTAPQQASQPQLASKPAPKQPLPVPDQPQEQGGPCDSTPPSTAPKAKQQSKADADKLARDELMQRRDWSYKDGYKPRWIIYCTTAIAPMIVEGAEIKPAGARRAPQDHVALIIPNDQWSPSQKGRRRRKRTTGRSSCPAARCSPPKAKRMRSWTSGSRGGRGTSLMKLWTSAPTQRQ